MSQSLAKIWTHVVFSTKERYPFLTDQSVRHDMHAYLAKILKAHNCPTLIIGGVSDHVHALFVFSKNHSIASIVWEIKRSSSKLGKKTRSGARKVSLAGRLWSILGKSVACRASAKVYSRSGDASSPANVSG